ncbi:MAG TPA: 3D domain-containing protein [Polyangia bacterium]
MTRTVIVAAALATLFGCNGIIVGPDEGPASSRKGVTGDAVLNNVQLTHYTLVTEDEAAGQHTGDASQLCNSNGLSGCYHKEFLCSGWGVAMEGTGIAANGQYVRYVSGGGGWSAGYKWLNNCASARFAATDDSYGSTGRALIEDFSIAVDRSVIPYGWFVYIESQGHWFRADDTGGAIIGRHIDIYAAGNRSYSAPATSRVYITATHHEQGDGSPFDGGAGADSPAGGGTGSACGSVTFEGLCQGSTLRWCENDMLRTADCAAQGMTCAYQDADIGYNCVAGVGTAPAPTPSCGDGDCGAGETCSSCPADCGACASGGAGTTCGDGWCDSDETCASCPADCGTCSSGGSGTTCGDGWCDWNEDCASCPADCGACSGGGSGTTCGVDGHLGLGENGDPCAEAPETWRCVYSDHWGTTASQVCRGGDWVTFELDPRDCEACCGDYSSACRP